MVSSTSAMLDAGRRTSTWSVADGTAPVNDDRLDPFSKDLSRLCTRSFSSTFSAALRNPFYFLALFRKHNRDSLFAILDLRTVL